MKLTKIIQDFLKSKDANPDNYNWEIKPSKLPCDLLIQGSGNFEQNINLKYKISSLWEQAARQNDKAKLLKLVNYVVSTWGGVHTNKDSILQGYLQKIKSSRYLLIQDQKEKGIASWSKILTFSAPDEFAIFDARVALSLNALQIFKGNSKTDFLRFPSLLPRSKSIKVANTNLNRYFKKQGISKAENFYPTYLKLLSEARLKGQKICEVEMLLFSAAPSFAERLIAMKL
jgi:hypothetical protein